MDEHKTTRSERSLARVARGLGRLPAAAQNPLSFVLSGRRRSADGERRLDPCLQLMLQISRRRNPFGLCEPDHVTARARFRHEVLTFEGPKTDVGRVSDGHEIPRPGGPAEEPLRARLYTPATEPPPRGRRLLVFLHGGGFVIGDIDTHDEACRLLCKHADTLVLSVEYRLAPEHPYPEPPQDALTAFRWAQKNAAGLGADPARVSVGGDSAGGNLSAVVAQITSGKVRPAWAEAFEGGPPPSAQLLIYPATDGSEFSRSGESRTLFGEGLFITTADYEAFGHLYTDGTGVAPDDPLVSPLCAGDLTGLPPALVVTAGFDLLRDEGEAYLRKLRQAHVDAAAAGAEPGAAEAESLFRLKRYDTLAHGFINMTGVCPSAHEATVDIARRWRALLDDAGL